MGNALEFIMKLVDQLSPAMKAAASITDSATERIKGAMDRVTARSRVMGASINDLRDKLTAVNNVRMSTRIADQFTSATREARRLEQQIDRLEGKKSTGGFGLGGLLAGVGIGSVATMGLQQAATSENNKIAFKVLTGSQASGDKLYNDIVKMADTTPYESQDLARSSKTMLGYGIDKSKIMPNLSMMGDISAAQDNPAQALQEMALALGQISAKGHLAGQETLQMVNAGFNPLKEISDITKISMADLDKQMSKGLITVDMVTAAMQHATGEGGKFHNMMIEQSNTLGGRWSTFMDGVHHKLRDLGTFLTPAAEGLMTFGTELLNMQGPALGLALAIGGITLALTWSSIAAKYMSIQTAILNAVMEMNPIARIIALVGLLVSAIIYAYTHFGWFRGIVQGAWEGLKAFGDLIKDFVLDSIHSLLKGISGIGEALWEFIQGDWKKAWETGKQAAKDLVGVDTISHALANGKKIGLAAQAGYANGVAEIANKNKAGVNPISATAGGTVMNAHSFDALGDGSAKAKADKINSGGQRSIVINIGKQIEKLELHTINMKEGVDEMGKMIREELIRVLYSVNGMQTAGA